MYRLKSNDKLGCLSNMLDEHDEFPPGVSKERMMRWLDNGLKNYKWMKKTEDLTCKTIAKKIDGLYSSAKSSKTFEEFLTIVHELYEISLKVNKKSSFAKAYERIQSVYSLLKRSAKQEDLNFDLLIKRSLFYSNKRHNLYTICSYAGEEIDENREELWDTDYVFVFNDYYNHRFGHKRHHVYPLSDALHRLYEIFPIVRRLSFKNYVIAGGAALFAVRSYKGIFPVEDRFMVRDVHQRYEGDIDIFIYGEDYEKTYRELLEELSFVLLCYFDVESSVVTRQEHCTTIFLKITEPGPFQRDYEEEMKIQIVHSLYEDQESILKSFDLAPCRVLFDGEDFITDITGLTSIMTNTIPLDMTASVGLNIPERTLKYCRHKDFTLILLGLSRENLEVEYAIQERNHDSQSGGPVFNQGRFRFYVAGNERYRGDAKILENHFYLEMLNPKPPGDTEILDYSGYALGFPCKIEDVAKKNVQIVLNGWTPVSVAENIHDLMEGRLTVPLSKERFEEGVSSLLETIDYVWDQTESFKKFEEMFGDAAWDIWTDYHTTDFKTVETHMGKRFKRMQKTCRSEEASCATVRWREIDPYESVSLREPGNRLSVSSLYPYGEFDPREFYGYGYNGFTITADWPAKMTIIRAYKNKTQEPGCLLVHILCKNMLKIIFMYVDLLTYEEPCYFNEASDDDSFDESED